VSEVRIKLDDLLRTTSKAIAKVHGASRPRKGAPSPVMQTRPRRFLKKYGINSLSSKAVLPIEATRKQNEETLSEGVENLL